MKLQGADVPKPAQNLLLPGAGINSGRAVGVEIHVRRLGVPGAVRVREGCLQAVPNLGMGVHRGALRGAAGDWAYGQGSDAAVSRGSNSLPVSHGLH